MKRPTDFVQGLELVCNAEALLNQSYQPAGEGRRADDRTAVASLLKTAQTLFRVQTNREAVE